MFNFRDRVSLYSLALSNPHGFTGFPHKWVLGHYFLNGQETKVPIWIMPREPEVSPNWFSGITMAGLSCSAKVLCTPGSASPTSLTNIGWVFPEAASCGLNTVDLVDDVAVSTRDGAGDGVGHTCEGAGV